MKNIVISNIKESDLKDVVDIQVDSWKQTYKGIIDDEFLNNMSKEAQLNKRKSDYKNGFFIVAKQKDKVTGFCRFVDNNNFSKNFDVDCEIMALYVKPNLKDNGIGTIMFDYVKTFFKKINKQKMIICCLDGNKIGENFYLKMGGIFKYNKYIEIGDKQYLEKCFVFDLNN